MPGSLRPFKSRPASVSRLPQRLASSCTSVKMQYARTDEAPERSLAGNGNARNSMKRPGSLRSRSHANSSVYACRKKERERERKREREREGGGGRALTEIGAGPLDACNTEFALITRAARHPLPAAASSSAFRQRVRREPGSFPLPGRRVQRTCRASVVIERQSFFPLLLFHNIAVRTSASFIVPSSMGAPHSWDRTRYRVIAAQRRRVVCPRVDDDLLVASVRRNPEEETHAPRENSRTPAARSLPTASGSSTYLAESSSGTRRRRPGTTSHPAPSVAVALSSGGWSKGLEYIRRIPR